MKIEFNKIMFRNIMSYGGDDTVYTFQNGIDIISGNNGNGKSSFIEALTFALFGKSFRKIKMAALINSINKNKLYVELNFNIDNKHYFIKRGMKPTIFEIYERIDGEYVLIDQNSTSKIYQNHFEENILNFNENVFRQLIVLGANLSDSKNFVDLNYKEKEEIFQVITDTSIFKNINDKLKERRNLSKEQIKLLNDNIIRIQADINLHESHIKQMEDHNNKIKNERDDTLTRLSVKKLGMCQENETLEAGIKKIESIEPELLEVAAERERLLTLINETMQREERTRVDINIKQYEDTPNPEYIPPKCPNCGFGLEEKKWK